MRRAGGRLACVAGVVGDAASPGGRRVGLVYTPPDLRRRGHAAALLDHVAAALLAAQGDAPGAFTAIVVGAPPPGAPAPPPLDGLWAKAGYARAAETREFALPAPAPAGGGADAAGGGDGAAAPE